MSRARRAVASPRETPALSPLVDRWYTLWHCITRTRREDAPYAPHKEPGQTEDPSTDKDPRQGEDTAQLALTTTDTPRTS
jgi:hypothetical protein